MEHLYRIDCMIDKPHDYNHRVSVQFLKRGFFNLYERIKSLPCCNNQHQEHANEMIFVKKEIFFFITYAFMLIAHGVHKHNFTIHL